jgi:hypothetical protein
MVVAAVDVVAVVWKWAFVFPHGRLLPPLMRALDSDRMSGLFADQKKI